MNLHYRHKKLFKHKCRLTCFLVIGTVLGMVACMDNVLAQVSMILHTGVNIFWIWE